MDRLKQFLRTNENAALAAGKADMMVHASPEGGTDTIGFGHKLTNKEIKEGKVYGIPLGKLDMEAAEHILEMDIAAKRKTLDRSLRKKYKVSLNDLSPRKQAMLLDYEFNLGSAVKVFPTFTKAVLDGDEDIQKDEMIRTYEDAQGNRKPLARNANFYNAFMSTDAKKAWGE